MTWAATFTPMPMPKIVCRTILYNKIVQKDVCIAFSGRGMGMDITAHSRRTFSVLVTALAGLTSPTILHYTILYYTILYYTILYYTILYIKLYYTILYYTILYYTILYYTILYYTILYYTILYYTILYYTPSKGERPCLSEERFHLFVQPLAKF